MGKNKKSKHRESRKNRDQTSKVENESRSKDSRSQEKRRTESFSSQYESKRRKHQDTSPYSSNTSENEKQKDLPKSDLVERIIQRNDEKMAVIFLKEDETLALQGFAKLQCISGKTRVLGYEFSPHTPAEKIYSPDCNNFLLIENINNRHDDLKDSEFNNNVSSLKVKGLAELVKTKLAQCRDCTSVIMLSNISSSECTFVASFHSFSSLFVNSNKQKHIVLHRVGITIFQADKRVVNMEEYVEVKEELNSWRNKGEKTIKIASCGGKNVGKSTMGRWLVNCLLNKYDEVAFLECDVGQSEFTPSGCVSLTVVRRPLLGPPFTHQRKSERCIFYSALTPSEDPDEYLRSVAVVYQYYLKKYSHVPLIVNTMGWNKGVGINLLVDTLHIIKPDVLIQLESYNHYKNLPCMRPEYVIKTQPWLKELKEDDKNGLKYKLILLRSAAESMSHDREKYKPADHRTLSLLAYFGVLNVMSLNTAQPYSVSWESMILYAGEVSPSHIMYALNCSVVALSHVETLKEEEYYQVNECRILKKLPKSDCFGFGIIRGIDAEKKIFYIISPVSSLVLQSVNCLVKGALDVPMEVLAKPQKSMTNSGPPPYITSVDNNSGSTIGATATKPRRHMVRLH